MSLKIRIEKLEQNQGTETVIPMTSGFDRFGPTDTIEQWQAACKLIDAEYARMKEEACHRPGRDLRHWSTWRSCQCWAD